MIWGRCKQLATRESARYEHSAGNRRETAPFMNPGCFYRFERDNSVSSVQDLAAQQHRKSGDEIASTLVVWTAVSIPCVREFVPAADWVTAPSIIAWLRGAKPMSIWRQEIG